jgi:hypothetical protein
MLDFSDVESFREHNTNVIFAIALCVSIRMLFYSIDCNLSMTSSLCAGLILLMPSPSL